MLIVLMAVFSMHAATLGVAQDGSQPYTSIQTAIDASTHGDIVLVYPGRYYENVRFYGKDITLASLEYITENRDYVYSTIIDANQNGVGIFVNDYETNVTIQGFTVVNGTGNYVPMYDWSSGGGIAIGRMSGQRSVSIVNCLVTGNRADNGAGVYLGPINAYLSGVSIHHNTGGAGAGIYFAGSLTQYNSIFDPINRCSIYNNFAANGSDLYYSNVNSVHVIVDTFTVADPWNFYATAITSNPNISNPYTFDILNTVHQEVNHDLYVAPWGDDANSGLSPSEPMKSVFNAMYRIASDSNDPKTVHVANGHYSPSLNGQLFPIPVKSHTRLIGESRNGTVFDAEGMTNLVSISAKTEEWTLRNMTLQNGKKGIVWHSSINGSVEEVTIKDIYDIRLTNGISGYDDSGTIVLQNVSIQNVTSPITAFGFRILMLSGLLMLRNVDILHCVSFNDKPVMEITTRNECDIIIEGSNIHNNFNNSPDVFNTMFQIAPFDNYGTRLRIEMKNSAFYDNYQAMPAQMGMARALNDTLFIENCTFAGNTGGSGAVIVQGTSVLTNNIFHNPAMSTQVWIPNYISSGINSHTTLRYNNILGGTSGVYNATSANPLIWGPGNTAYDPLFSYEGNRPYTLSSLSPLIDTGWQNASGLSEPGFDAGGNERLWDGDGDGIAVIDVGAYEYQPIFAPQNLSAELWQNQVLLSWEMPISDRGLSGYRVFRDHLPYADVSGAGNTYFREHISQADTLVYQVAALYGNVESALSDSVVVIVFTTDNADELAPALTKLLIGPNPFSDIAVIRYTLPKTSKVELKIYNLRGQLVRTLESGTKNPGEHVLAWEGCDANARPLASGIYFLQLQVDGVTRDRQKVILMK